MIVTTTYLEQLDPDDLVPAREPTRPAEIVRVDEPSPEFARFLYTAVGGDWYWTRRLPWSLAQWTDWLARPGSETWVAWIDGSPAGYVELSAEIHGAATDAATDDRATHAEIVCFGLLPRFLGRGLGGQLLTAGIRRAWTLHERFADLPRVTRVWVHTCTLDGPHALRNYTARGLRIYDTRQAEKAVAATPPGPWPGAREG